MTTKRVFALLALALSGFAPQAFAACKVGTIVDFPVTMAGTRPLVNAKINGQDASFIADSGAFFSMITPASADQYNLPKKMAPFGFRVSGIGGDADVSLATVKTFTLAKTDIPRLEFIVGGGEPGAGAVGLMGQNILGLADVEYDLGKGDIKLMQAEGCYGAVMVYWDRTAPYSVVGMVSPPNWGNSSNLRSVSIGEAFVNGARIRVIFDTGASTSVLSRSAAARAGVKPDMPGVISAGFSAGIGRKTIRTWIGPFASFKIGDEEIRNTKLRFGEIDLQNADMLLGADFFLSHHIYVANSQHKIYFTYNGGPVFNLTATPGPPAAEAGQATQAAAPPGELEAQPKDAEDFARRGQVYAARHDLDHALADLDQAVTLAPTEPRYLHERALIHLEKKQPFLAMGDLDQALKLKPDDAVALVQRAELRLGGNDKTEAKADLDAADGFAPKEADIRQTMAMLYMRLDLFEQAVAQNDLWIKAHPGDSRQPIALNSRCRGRAFLGKDLDKALNDCNAALRMAPKSAEVLDSRGLVHLRQGEFDRAIADYDASIALQPKEVWSLYGRGVAKSRKGLAAEGQADIAAAVAIRPKIADFAKRYGVTP